MLFKLHVFPVQYKKPVQPIFYKARTRVVRTVLTKTRNTTLISFLPLELFFKRGMLRLKCLNCGTEMCQNCQMSERQNDK